MARTPQQTPAPTRSGNSPGGQAEFQRLVEEFDGMLSRLRLGPIRDQLEGLMNEVVRRQLNLGEGLAWLCEAEVAHEEQ